MKGWKRLRDKRKDIYIYLNLILIYIQITETRN